MNSKHRRTLVAIYASPAPTNIPWSDIESLLIGVGCQIKEGAGSRVKFTLRDSVFAAHRPHPRKEAKEYAVRAVRDFLKANGVEP